MYRKLILFFFFIVACLSLSFAEKYYVPGMSTFGIDTRSHICGRCGKRVGNGDGHMCERPSRPLHRRSSYNEASDAEVRGVLSDPNLKINQTYYTPIDVSDYMTASDSKESSSNTGTILVVVGVVALVIYLYMKKSGKPTTKSFTSPTPSSQSSVQAEDVEVVQTAPITPSKPVVKASPIPKPASIKPEPVTKPKPVVKPEPLAVPKPQPTRQQAKTASTPHAKMSCGQGLNRQSMDNLKEKLQNVKLDDLKEKLQQVDTQAAAQKASNFLTTVLTLLFDFIKFVLRLVWKIVTILFAIIMTLGKQLKESAEKTIEDNKTK